MYRPLLLSLLISAFATGFLAAQTVDPPTGQRVDLSAVQQNQPDFLVRAELNHPSGQYAENETLSLRVTTEEDAYLYIEYQQADGQTFQIFPNSAQPDNRLRAKQTVTIPGENDRFVWKISPPYGKETIKVVASRKPLVKLEAKNLREKRFNPLGAAEWKGAELEIDEQRPRDWTEHAVTLLTAQTVEKLPGGRRMGVFFGVSKHQISPLLTSVGPPLRSLDLSSCKNDAEKLHEVMSTVGKLDRSQVFTDEQATFANLQEAITKWLPSVTRPEDTVFIYFSGHGGQIADDGTDEVDKLDEYLVPHDFVDGGLYQLMDELNKRGKLPKAYEFQYRNLKQLAQKFGGNLEQLNQHLTRTTGLSDDLMTRWLQDLSGRQVVVILDICHSGGFAIQEKSFLNTPSAGFDYLGKELGRLKDLGQLDEALLAASRADELSQVRYDKEFSVMTKAMLDGLARSSQQVTLQDSYEHCQRGIDLYFTEVNRLLAEAAQPPKRAHHPVLINYCRRMPLVKP